MSIRYISISIIIAVLFVASACEDFLDVNEDPNNVTEVSVSALLPTVIEGTSAAHYEQAFQINQVTQHIGSYFDYFPEEFRLGDAWTKLYLQNMANLDQIILQAEENGSSHYTGVARVLMALNLGMTTDVWEAAPYDQAFNGSENFKPSYDSQESLYMEIFELLDQAMQDLAEPNSFLSPAGDDLAYGGDLDAWMRLANTLKARYSVHLLNKGGTWAQDALNALDNGIMSNGDDFQLDYNTVNKNPWHTNVALANNTGNFSVTYGSYFIDILTDDLGVNALDPRIAVIADTIGESEFIGIEPFDQNAPAPTLDFGEQTWYSTERAPILMVTNAEARFIEAEAAFESGNNGRAYQAYLDGIRAHMEKVGVPQDQIDNYIALPEVSMGAGNLTLADIMLQKYIALFLHPEAWVDMRRHDYSTALYEGFETPDVGVFGGSNPERALYPLDELNRNGENVQAVQKGYGEPMWRDE